MLAGLVVGVAEVVLYAAYLSKMGRAKKKEKRKVEKKTVIGELGAGLANKAVDLEPVKVGNQEKEEIWGKGVNGGARRRVRERWKEQAVDE